MKKSDFYFKAKNIIHYDLEQCMILGFIFHELVIQA